MYTKNVPDMQKLKFKGGAVVDPDSNLEDKASVYKVFITDFMSQSIYYFYLLQANNKFYNSVLGYTNLERGTNSYYKLQLLQKDGRKNRFYLFRAWGRIGTTIGGSKVEDYYNVEEAVRAFDTIYEEKSGKPFLSTNKDKIAGKFYPLDIDYGKETESIKLDAKESKSKLNEAVKNLISLLFDIERMKSTLVEFEVCY